MYVLHICEADALSLLMHMFGAARSKAGERRRRRCIHFAPSANQKNTEIERKKELKTPAEDIFLVFLALCAECKWPHNSGVLLRTLFANRWHKR
jgi:hypothetical protein